MKFCAIAIEELILGQLSGYSIGVAKFRDDYIEGTWGCSVGPGPCLPGFPGFAEVAAELWRYVDGGILVHHGSGSRLVIERDAKAHGIAAPTWTWLDSLDLTQRAWPNLTGFADLSSLARELGIDCQRGDAVEHAVATGVIALELARTLGTEVDLMAQLAVIPNPA